MAGAVGTRDMCSAGFRANGCWDAKVAVIKGVVNRCPPIKTSESLQQVISCDPVMQIDETSPLLYFESAVLAMSCQNFLVFSLPDGSSCCVIPLGKALDCWTGQGLRALGSLIAQN